MIDIAKHSIGKLRPANHTNPKSPNLTGKIALQKPTIDGIVKRLEEQGGDEIICNMAAWFNQDRDGKYITIQISPPFKRPSEHMTVNEFFEDLENGSEE